MWPQGCFKLEFSHAGLTDNRDARGGSWEEVSCAFTKECGRVAFTTIKTARFADTSEFLEAKKFFKKMHRPRPSFSALDEAPGFI